MTRETKDLYVTQENIETGVMDIIQQMYKDKWRPDYIVGIIRGGLLPAVMMSHFLSVTMYALDVRLRDSAGEEGPESNAWMSEDAFGVFQQGLGFEAKNILVLDDINDTGSTLNWIEQDWASLCRPDDTIRWREVWHTNVRFAVIVNNLSSKFDVDYHSIEINKADDPAWVVFPYEKWW
jgi:xanthine phosphoribosyltransferase